MTNKVVFDTNILISAYLWGGLPRKALELTRTKKWLLVISKESIREFIRVLGYSKFGLSSSEIRPILKDIEEYSEFFEIDTSINIIKEDVFDNLFLSLAIDSNARYIVSGDSHLLNLKRYKNIEIISVKRFMELTKDN